MKLLKPFGFTDSNGVYWEVPAGYVTNGASIPPTLWSVVGGPYEGPYRDAAVLHDYFVDEGLAGRGKRTWEETHTMFRDASLARGVSNGLVQLMYGSVRLLGPRWEMAARPTPELQRAGAAGGPETPAPTPPAPAPDAPAAAPAPVPAPAVVPRVRGLRANPAQLQELQMLEELQAWIEQNNPNKEDIDRKVEEMRRARGLPAIPPK
jgi:hypothetical protein